MLFKQKKASREKQEKTTKKKKMLDKKANIYTKNKDGSHDVYHIRKNRIYICPSDYYGEEYTISSPRFNRKNVHIITEFYETEKGNNRFRFRLLNLKNAKKFRTIEKLPDGTERKIAVIEKFDEADEYICSIGDIERIISDLTPEQKVNENELIKKLQLILPRDYYTSGKKEEEKKRAA